MFRCIARFLALTVLVAVLGAASAQAQVQPYGQNDFGGFRNVLPPGTNGFDNAAQLALFEAAGQRPAHSSDQLGMYDALTTAAGNVTQATIPQDYKDATFGVPAGDVQSTQTPEPGVTIVRDKQYGVPHIYGDTRPELMFGIGYATAEDRLFFIDALRHSGEGDLASFAGGANVSMDESVWQAEPYTHQDLVNQVNNIRSGPGGEQLYQDATSYVNGINAYIAAAKQPLNILTMMPGEYAAIGRPGGPAPFTLEDLVSIATLVGGIFGNGGGDQLYNAQLYQSMLQKFGAEHRSVAGSPQVIAKPKQKSKKHKKPTKPKKPAADHSGFATFLSFDDPNDPEAPTTVHSKTFDYQTLPRPSKAVRATIALPDPGSVKPVNTIAGGAAPSGQARAARTPGKGRAGPSLGARANAGPGLLGFPRAMSNALLISGKDSASGHPLAVMGPQVSYFAPEILMEEDIHGPGVDADGAAFPGGS